MYQTALLTFPSVDDVEEFTVQTNALDAEYGHGGGMYVNVTTKSGTNRSPRQVSTSSSATTS